MISNSERSEISSSHFSRKLVIDDERLRILKGWHNTLAEQLVIASGDDEIIKRTPRDHNERFASAEAANEWYARDEHIVYSLAQAANLAGIIWFTKYDTPVIENADYTFAIRMYEGARGKGLAGNFARAVLLDFEATESGSDVWLETDTDNDAALHLYESLGFAPISSAKTRTKMVRPGVMSRLGYHHLEAE